MQKERTLPGNALDWISRAQNIANRLYTFRGAGFVFLADRKAGNEWSRAEKDAVHAILFQVERDAVARILDKWLSAGKIRPCRIVANFISQNHI